MIQTPAIRAAGGIKSVYTRASFFDAPTCQAVRNAMDVGCVEPADILAQDVATDTQARHASIIDVDPHVLAHIEDALDAERQAIAAFFAVTLSSREGAGLVRYGPGGFYGPHRDRAELASWPEAARRLLAVVVFLNSSREGGRNGEFSGGMLRLLGERPVDVVPARGLLVAFPAATLHEVTPVIDGRRDVIVDWFY